MLRRDFLALGALPIVGCGGGSQPKATGAPPMTCRPIVAFYGDSLTFGVIDNPGGLPTLIGVPPCRRAAETGGFTVLNYSLPGATCGDALAGVAMMPFGPFAQHIKTDAASLCVFRYGAGEAIRGVSELEYTDNLTQLVRLTRAAGKKVMIVGSVSTVVSDAVPAAVAARIDSFNNLARAIAQKEAVVFVDTRTVTFNGASDLGDSIHPNQAYSDRITAVIVAAIQRGGHA